MVCQPFERRLRMRRTTGDTRLVLEAPRSPLHAIAHHLLPYPCDNARRRYSSIRGVIESRKASGGHRCVFHLFELLVIELRFVDVPS